jgi:hypothetical protein
MELPSSPVRQHSRKPDEVYKGIQRYCDGPYLELFARAGRRAAWRRGSSIVRRTRTSPGGAEHAGEVRDGGLAAIKGGWLWRCNGLGGTDAIQNQEGTAVRPHTRAFCASVALYGGRSARQGGPVMSDWGTFSPWPVAGIERIGRKGYIGRRVPSTTDALEARKAKTFHEVNQTVAQSKIRSR